MRPKFLPGKNFPNILEVCREESPVAFGCQHRVSNRGGNSMLVPHGRWQRYVLVSGLVCLLGFVPAERSLAASTILSTGFESPYVPGPLQSQPAMPPSWITAGAGGSTAMVETSIVNSGSQAVQVVKAAAANTDRRWAIPVTGYPTQRFMIIDWDMRVT